MRKQISIVAIGVLAVSLIGCGQKSEVTPAISDHLQVTAGCFTGRFLTGDKASTIAGVSAAVCKAMTEQQVSIEHNDIVMVSSAMDAVEDPEDVVSEATVLDEDTWNVRPVDEVVSIEETKAAAEAEEKAEAKAKAAAEAKERKDRIFSYRENYANLYANTYIDKTYVDMAIEECKKYGVSPYLIVAQIEAESSGQPDAVSCANAVGLMQIIEKWNYDTMEEFGVTDLTDPKGNIQVGVKIMSCLLSKYDTKTALMCYNEGEYGTARKRAAEGNYSAYAKKITARAEELKK